METKIITVPIRRPWTREEQRRHRNAVKGLVLCITVVTVALIVGSIIGWQCAQATSPASTNRTVEQMVSKLEIHSATVVSTLDKVQMSYPEQMDKPAWDIPLTNNELAALLESCEAGHIAPAVALGLIRVESGFRADALNPGSGCYGYCQLNPRYFPSDLSPVDNIRTGIGYLSYQLERYDNLEAALTAYNAGHDTGDRTYANMVLEAATSFGGVMGTSITTETRRAALIGRDHHAHKRPPDDVFPLSGGRSTMFSGGEHNYYTQYTAYMQENFEGAVRWEK